MENLNYNIYYVIVSIHNFFLKKLFKYNLETGIMRVD